MIDLTLFGMKPNLSKWEKRSVHPLAARDRVPDPYHDCNIATLAVEPPGEPTEDGPFTRLEQTILSYQIFGSEIGRPLVRTSPVREGDTVGLHYNFLGPLRIVIACRVVEVFHRQRTAEGWRSGFIYRTLEGHPELGEEIFEVTKLESGPVIFRIEAWSRPNLWIVRLLKFWARAIQAQAADSALRRMLGVAQGRF